jgi:hypothetical protein
MTAAAAQFRHVFGFLTVFGTVFSELAVWLDRARTTGVSALLRLIHTASCSQDLTGILSHDRPRRTRLARSPTGRNSRSGALGITLRACVHLALGSQDTAPIFMLGDGHAALHADTDPLRRLAISGKQLLEDRHERSLPTLPQTDFPAGRFAESKFPGEMHGKDAARRYNSAGL